MSRSLLKMKSYIFFNCSFLLVAFFVSHASTEDFEQANERFMKNLDCVSESGNQDLCDKFSQCNEQFPDQVLDSYYICFSVILQNDTKKCNEKEELYESANKRRRIDSCTFGQVRNLDYKEYQQLNAAFQCTADLAEKAGCAVKDNVNDSD